MFDVTESASIHRDPQLRELEDRILALAAHIDAATFRWLELVREFDEAEGWAGDGIRSCAHWLGWRCGISLHAAREKLRVAYALKALPDISAAFRDGRISYSKARALTRIATPGNETFLLGIARKSPAWVVERTVKNYRRMSRVEALEQENRRHGQRRLDWFCDDDGSVSLVGRFSPEQGAVIRRALDAVLEEMFDEEKNVPAGTSGAPEPEFDRPCPPQPASQRRADALVRIAEGWLSGTESRPRGDRFVINVHTDVETLKKKDCGENGCGSEAELEDGGNVPAETCRRLACDAGVVRWMEDRDGQAFSIGRKSRTIPPSIRRALHRRDGGCRFPGCSATRFVDGHHIRHWADGGETSLNNLVLLCRHHHRLVHEGGFGLQRTPGGGFEFTTPDGRHLPMPAEERPRGDVLEIIAGNAGEGIRITPKTPLPDWLGERIDHDTVLHHLHLARIGHETPPGQ